jgi:hypothetical protein
VQLDLLRHAQPLVQETPGIRTTYSSPTRISPSSPCTLKKRANSVGATWFGSARIAATTSSGDSLASRIRAR